jgi:hypothetical protein
MRIHEKKVLEKLAMMEEPALLGAKPYHKPTMIKMCNTQRGKKMKYTR